MYGDCLVEMANIADGSVDLIVTDPPYYSTNLAFDKAPRIDYKQWLIDCKRVLKDTGVLVSFCDLNLLIELRSHKVFKTAYEIVWEKTMAMGFLDANIRPLRAHEFIIVMTNALKKSTYNPQKIAGKAYAVTHKNDRTGHVHKHKDCTTINTGDRHPRTVQKFSNNNHKSLHPTQKPIDLCQWLINSYSNADDVVLDCFMGGGSVKVAAQLTGRNFIGIELDAHYFEIAKNRIEGAQYKEVDAA
jgi:site-specific DNA-methyltransferase (adenine-specific)